MDEDKIKIILRLAFKAAQQKRLAVAIESESYFRGQEEAYLKVLDILTNKN